MRYLIVSDIHSNREALEAVVDDAAGSYDRVLCCGDLVGYGADPEYAIEWTRANASQVVRGNHDKACAGLDDLEWFNPAARASALWTHQTIGAEDLQYLTSLLRGPAYEANCSMVHGSPVDEDEYVVNTADAVGIASYLETPVTLFGHTHLQGGFLVHRNGVLPFRPVGAREKSATVELDPDSLYLINPGSVGQPRDGDPRAAYALFWPEKRLVEYRRVTYDVAAAQRKIREAGLPGALADRLARGL